MKWGLAWALALATFFSAWVLLLAALRGSAKFEQYGMTVGEIVGAYYATAVVVGTLLGLCRPFTRTRPGAMAVGSLVGTALYSGIGVSMDGFKPSTFLMGAIIGIPMGALLARKFWKQENPRDRVT